MCKISVVVPVYNCEEYLYESINSILNQSFTDFEVICVNDGSTDQSLRILNNLKKEDNRIIIIDKQNGGCGSARNVGIENASGDYIYFFDPDDYVNNTALEKLYENAENNNSDIVLSQIAWYQEGNKINFDKPGFDLDALFTDVDFNRFTFNYSDIKDYVLNSYFAPWTKLYKNSFLKENSFRFEEHIAFDDVPFHVQTIIESQRISFVPEAFYYYRTNNSGSVNNTSSNAPDIIRICDIVEEFLKEKSLFETFKPNFYKFKTIQLLLYIISSNSETYYKYVKNEFLKMNIEENILSDELLENYNMVINSKDYTEYRQMRNVSYNPDNIKTLNNKINELNETNHEQKNIIRRVISNNELINNKYVHTLNEEKTLKTEYDILNNKYENIKKENEKLLTANKILSDENKRLDKEKSILEKENMSLIEDNDELNSLKKTVLNSHSWKITKPLRSLTMLIKKIK